MDLAIGGATVNSVRGSSLTTRSDIVAHLIRNGIVATARRAKAAHKRNLAAPPETYISGGTP